MDKLDKDRKTLIMVAYFDILATKKISKPTLKMAINIKTIKDSKKLTKEEK